MKSRTSHCIPIATMMVLIPSMAFANAGTPLMMVGLLYLFGGNVVLGAVEGFVLAKWFDLPVKRCIRWMIVANLLSAWVGQAGLSILFHSRLGIVDLNSLATVHFVAPFVAWILTLVLEWPFTATCFRGDPRWLPKSVLATGVIQTISCALVGLCFYMISAFGVMKEHTIVPCEELPWPTGLVIFHIDQDGRSIRAYDTDTGESRTVHVLRNQLYDLHAAVHFSKEPAIVGSTIHHLVAGQYGWTRHVKPPERLGIEVNTAVFQRFGEHLREGKPMDRSKFPFGPEWAPYGYENRPLSIGEPPADLKTIRQGIYGIEGLIYEYGKGTPRVNLNLETPFAAFAIRDTMLLGDGITLFSTGTNQICLLDMRTRRVALKLRGFGPMAVPKAAIVKKSEE